MIIINLDKKKQIISKYNSTSKIYDKRYLKIQYEKFEILLKDFRLDEKIILDAGCGTGLLFEYLIKVLIQEKYLVFSYIAVDISWKMINRFYSKLKNFKNNTLHQQIHLIISDIENLPLRNNVFHSIFAPTSLQNLPSMQKGIQEIISAAKNQADFKLTILKKKLDIEKLNKYLEPKIKNLEFINIINIEDIIIQGFVNKN